MKTKIILLLALLPWLPASMASASPESFTLYSEPRYVPSLCDEAQELTVDYEAGVATLIDVVVGVCPRSIDENRRTYDLTEVDRSAQGVLASGESTRYPGSRIEIRDRRESALPVSFDSLIEIKTIDALEASYFSNP